ncbi:MAG: polysaccharide biosynthesis protein [Lentimicrobium sp.]|nr:polysaccharide biosynthesis protein [Lentimicrobium sp.]
MIKKFILSFANRFMSRWVILAKDMILLGLALISAYLLRFNFILSDPLVEKMWFHLWVTLILALISFLIFKPYAGIIRHTSFEDVLRLGKSMLLLGVSMLILNRIVILSGVAENLAMPYSILIIFLLSGTFILLFTRMLIKLVFSTFSVSNVKKSHILIYGAGQAGQTALRVISSDKESALKVIGFLDHNEFLKGKILSGIPVYSPEEIDQSFIDKNKVINVVFSVQNIPNKTKQSLIEDLISRIAVEVKEIPPASSWINGELTLRQLEKVKIEDLLQRDPIQLEMKQVLDEFNGKTILVTGAAGSIGSEISRQLCRVHPKRIIFLDQAETPLYDLQQELMKLHPEMSSRFVFVISDISIPELVDNVFRQYRPQMVYHAAAYKHVPLMESNPFEAVRVNIFGTRIVANAASKYEALKFVMISTDKAVNPSSVMGASKRAAEIYIQSLILSPRNQTAFITTRFGNVLGSNGSVIPLFEKQIQAGGPVTVTHPDIIRYFMTIPEACQLVLDASVMGKGGEIFLFDMGKPVKIHDLAIQMIRLSGRRPGKDIHIEFTGLRPGEKLFEELLFNNENQIPTHHPKITIAQVHNYPPDEVKSMFLDLQDSFRTFDQMEVIAQLKRIVPEFKSQNSEYQQLDHIS